MRAMKDLIAVAVGALAALYLVNPTAGFFEFIPDVLPVVGNLDEATATLVLVSVFRYFGMDVSRFFQRDNRLPERVDDPRAR